ncbi:BTB domain-containing protein [Mycena kentingensis (nom. inval.)]|nr:BTB domain-containing protein [Mycena kentingensis (nom. inval.)]
MNSRSPSRYTYNASPALSESAARIVKDPRYFYSDGDVVFCVKNVLFKLHKCILVRDPSSMFRELFNLSKPAADGVDIIPVDDSVEDFRALCWALYALPNEIVSQAHGRPDFEKLLRVVRMSNKYLLIEFESWAWNMIARDGGHIADFLAICSEDTLETLLHFATALQSTKILELVEDAWMPRIRNGQASYTRALSAGEINDRRTFQGDILLELRRSVVFGDTLIPPEQGFANLGLTDAQLSRLLIGHTLLSNAMHHVQTAPLKEYCNPTTGAGCQNHALCRSRWKEALESKEFDEKDVKASVGVLRKAGKDSGVDCIASFLDLVSLGSDEAIAGLFLGDGAWASPTGQYQEPWLPVPA